MPGNALKKMVENRREERGRRCAEVAEKCAGIDGKRFRITTLDPALQITTRATLPPWSPRCRLRQTHLVGL
jgi:hypothetical protein